MTDLDQRITDALRERAEGAVDTRRLTARAVAGGRARRRRRRMGAGVALGLTAVLGLGTLAGLPGSGRGTVLPGLPGAGPKQVAPGVVAAPPRVAGVAGAATRPDLVGTDPGLLHFGVDPVRARLLTWRTGRGVEGGRLELPGGRVVAVDLGTEVAAVEDSAHDGMAYPARPATAADFDGRVRQVPPGGPGGQPGWFLRWQPVPGLYARVHTVATDDADLREAVAALRLDEAHRCASPLRLTALPPAARLATCEVNVIGFPGSLDVRLTVSRSPDQQLEVRLEYRSGIAGSRTEGNRTINGRAAYLYPQGGELELLGLEKAHLVARFGWPYEGFTDDDAATVLGGAVVATDLTRPETWN
ncbi:hypothetical protein [Micromonospora sp. NPDC092111]|uniref:hypothetical protein n=1 Tax=Micromonospora sp. NPDC092111 TaxID=3364289 RepID=UPI00382269BA